MMENLPYPWSVYARLQGELSDTPQVDDQSWGLEAGLDSLLEAMGRLPDETEIERTIESAGRRERYRARLRRTCLAIEPPNPDQESIIAAREELDGVQRRVLAEDWALLCAIGEGNEYGELVAAQRMPAGSLRVRVLRLRKRLGEEASQVALHPVRRTAG